LLGAGCGQDGSSPLSSGIDSISDTSSGTGSASGVGVVSVSLSRGVQAEDGTVTATGRPPLPDSDIAQLFLTFDSIRIYPMPDSVPADSGRYGGHGPHGPGPFCPPDSTNYIEMLTDPITVDVMTLSETLGTLLDSDQVPEGDYSHLALRISQAWAFTDSGQQVTVALAGPDSLLRVLSHFSVVAGEPTEIEISIDLDRSVHEVPPGSGNYVLKPVLFGEFHGPGGGHGGPHGGGPGGPGGPPPGGSGGSGGWGNGADGSGECGGNGGSGGGMGGSGGGMRG